MPVLIGGPCAGAVMFEGIAERDLRQSIQVASFQGSVRTWEEIMDAVAVDYSLIQDRHLRAIYHLDVIEYHWGHGGGERIIYYQWSELPARDGPYTPPQVDVLRHLFSWYAQGRDGHEMQKSLMRLMDMCNRLTELLGVKSDWAEEEEYKGLRKATDESIREIRSALSITAEHSYNLERRRADERRLSSEGH